MPALGQTLAAAAIVGLLGTLLSGAVRALTSRRRATFGAALLDGAILASLAAVVVATLSPLELLFVTDPAPEINLQPFDRLDGAPTHFAVINLLLLVPTVLLLAQRWRRAGVLRLTVLAFLLSVSIELAQLFHPARGTNVDDVALNTAGALGAAVIGVTLRAIGDARHRRAARRRQRARLEAEVAAPADRAVQRAT